MVAIAPLGELYKATWSGVIGTEEIFNYSRWITSTNTADQEAVATALALDVTEMLATAVTAGPVTTLNTAFPSHVAWKQLKVSWWSKGTNKLEAGTTPALRTLTNTPGGTSSGGLPYQIAFAMTTRSLLAGRKKWNRFYLPTMVNSVTDGKGTMVASVVSALGLWLHLNITSRAAGSPNLVYCNYNPGTPPYTFAIQDSYLGGRMDTIRRRRNQAPETRLTTAV